MIAKTWYMLDNSSNALPERATQEPLLWGLLLMKSYDSEVNNAACVGGVDEGTFREWSWFFIYKILYLESFVVSTFCI